MKSFAFLLSVFVPAAAFALPAAEEFKRVKNGPTAKIENCSVTGIESAVTLRATVDSSRINVSLPNSFEKQAKAVGTKKHRFAACGVSDADPTKSVLFLKEGKDDTTAVEVSLALGQFEDQGDLGKACKTVRPWLKNFIYKTVGSHHFTDIRRNTVGLIMTYGANVPTPGCIDILAVNGDKISDFGFYASGAGWYARYYGGIGCGDAINGAALGARARKAGGSNNMYVRIGTTCYGPVNSTQCIGSKAC